MRAHELTTFCPTFTGKCFDFVRGDHQFNLVLVFSIPDIRNPKMLFNLFQMLYSTGLQQILRSVPGSGIDVEFKVF